MKLTPNSAFEIMPKECGWKLTPKAFANSSPGLERSDNPGIKILNKHLTLKGFANHLTLSGLIAS